MSHEVGHYLTTWNRILLVVIHLTQKLFAFSGTQTYARIGHRILSLSRWIKSAALTYSFSEISFMFLSAFQIYAYNFSFLFFLMCASSWVTSHINKEIPDGSEAEFGIMVVDKEDKFQTLSRICSILNCSMSIHTTYCIW